MADIIGQETWTADGKSYVIKVTEPGATVTENAINIISPVIHRSGSPNYDPLEPILKGQLRFDIKDTGKLFQSAIDGKQVGDIVIEFTEDSNVLFKGFVVPQYQRSLLYQTNPEYTVTATDGISGLKGFTYDQVGAQSVRDQFYYIANKIGLALQLNIVFDWEHNGADSGTDDVDKLQIPVEQLISDENATYYSVLETLCKFYVGQFFQEDGEWYFMQRAPRGASMTIYPTSSAKASLTDETGTLTYAVADSLIHRKDSFFSFYPAHSRVVSKHEYVDYLIKNPDWTEGNKYWDTSGDDSASAERRRISADAGYLRQTLGTSFIISDGSNDRLAIDFMCYIGIPLSATGTYDVGYAEVKAEATDGTKYYLTTAGAWQTTTQTYITVSVNLTTFSGSVFSFPASLLTPQVPQEPMRMTLTLYFDKDASGDPADIDYIEYGPVSARHLKPAEEDDVFRATEYVVTQETDNLGDSYEETFTIGDTDDDTFYGPGVFEYYDGTDWLPTQSWSPDTNRVHQKRSLEIRDQLDARLKSLELSHKFGEVPKLYNTLIYGGAANGFGDAYTPNFIEREYSRNAKPYVKSSSKQLLDVSVLINVPPTHVYFAEATQIHKVPILSTASGWSSEQVDTITADRNYLKIAVDEAAGYIFAVEQNLTTSTTRYVTRRDLDGGNLTTLLTYSSGSTGANTIDLGRINNHLYVGAENFGAVYNGFTLSRYDYDGAAVDTLVTSSDSLLHAIGVDSSETYMFYRENKVGLGPFDRLRRFTLSDSTNSILVDPAVTPSSNSPIHNIVVDNDGGVFYSGDSKIVEFAYSDGTGENNLETSADSDAIGKDRANQQIYYIDNTDQIYRMGYDGSSKESVLNHDEDIRSLCLGFN